MRYWLAGIFALVTAGIAVVAPASAGIDEAYRKPADKMNWGELLADFVGHRGFGKSYALVVGISDFDDYPSLPTANDPLRMRNFLIDEAGFDYVHVLSDEKATKARVEELMVDVLPGMIHENDQFLFYWSGHGTQRPNALGGYVGYLPLASSPKNRYGTMISMGDIQRWDEILAAKQALFLLDACFSGLAGSVSKTSHRELQIEQLDKPAHHLVSAGTREEQTIAGDRWGGSIFADAVLRAVRGEADAETSYPKDGVVSLSELIGYIRTRVAIEAPAAGWTKSLTPQQHDLRTSTGEFFFLTSEHKRAKLEGAGARYQGRFEYGMPMVVLGNGPPPACDPEADQLYWETIRNETAPGYFEAYLKLVESGELCGLFADIARLKLEALLAALPSPTEQAPQQSPVPAEPDPAAAEAALNLRLEDRKAVQEALTALGFDTQGIDGVFGAKTRRAIMGWQRGRGDHPTRYLTSSQYGDLLIAAEPKLAALAAARQPPEPATPVEAVVGIDHYQPRDEFQDCEDCPLMVVVPAGSFTMGSTETERKWASEQGCSGNVDHLKNEKPQHGVEIEYALAVGKYEVTFDEWEACVGDGGCNNYAPSDADYSDRHMGRGRRPVINVSWNDTQAYVAWLKLETRRPYRLLSEAEWEYVARAGTTTRYSWGDDFTRQNANGSDRTTYSLSQTAPVGSYPANPWGLHDMHGNVLELVEDCANNSYQGAPTDGSAWLEGDCAGRMTRGGSWQHLWDCLRSAYRSDSWADSRESDIGFRVARTLTP